MDVLVRGADVRGHILVQLLRHLREVGRGGLFVTPGFRQRSPHLPRPMRELDELEVGRSAQVDQRFVCGQRSGEAVEAFAHPGELREATR